MVIVYEEDREEYFVSDSNSFNLSYLWRSKSAYLTDIIRRAILGDCVELEGYFRITKSDVECLKMDVIEEFHSANKELNIYIDAVTDLMNLLREMDDEHKYVVKIIENEGDEK